MNLCKFKYYFDYYLGMGKTVTSLKIDDDIWKEIKIKAIQQDKQLTEVLDEALKNWLTIQGRKK